MNPNGYFVGITVGLILGFVFAFMVMRFAGDIHIAKVKRTYIAIHCGVHGNVNLGDYLPQRKLNAMKPDDIFCPVCEGMKKL